MTIHRGFIEPFLKLQTYKQRTAPCKTFAGAISETAAQGEINCVDPGGFGAVTITKAVTISCEMGTAGVLVAGTNGVVVAAGVGDTVVLRGLDFIGSSSGINAIRLTGARALLVDKCNISGLTNFGMTSSRLGSRLCHVMNTTVTNTGTASAGGGVLASAEPSGFTRVVLNNVVVERSNFFGVSAVGTGSTSE